MKQNNKRAVETFLVVKADQALFNTGSSTVSINQLTTGGAVPKGTTTLADGQVGVFAADGYGSAGINNAIASGNTILHAPQIYIAAGLPRDASTNLGEAQPYPLWRRPYERSGNINGSNQAIGTYQAYRDPQFSAWMTGNPIGTAGEVNIIDETEYIIQIAETGYANDIFYSSTATNVIQGSFVTPNYTALGTVNPVDHLIQNIAYDFNRNSIHLGIYNNNVFHGNSNIIAFAISPDATTGEDISALSAGDVVTVVSNVNLGGTITMTDPLIETLQDALASNTDWPSDSSIVPIDLSTAGTNAVGDSAEGIIFVSLDRNTAYVDRIPFLKSTIKAGLNAGFDYVSVYNAMANEMDEGQGTYRQVLDQYKKTHHQRLYNLNQTEFPIIEFPHPFTSTAKYNQFIITHIDSNQIDTTNVSESPLKTIVCVPNTETTFVTAFTTLMNAWFASANIPAFEVI